jgi:hypothetical protein
MSSMCTQTPVLGINVKADQIFSFDQKVQDFPCMTLSFMSYRCVHLLLFKRINHPEAGVLVRKLRQLTPLN